MTMTAKRKTVTASFEPGEISDQEIQVTLSGSGGYRKMLDAIYPVELSWISGEEFGVYNWDYRIDVTVVPEGKAATAIR